MAKTVSNDSPLDSNFKASSSELTVLLNNTVPTVSIKFKNCSFLLTKSVSLLTSYKTALLPSTMPFVKPSAAILAPFLAALAIPFSLKYITACSISPLVSSSAFLQSSIPAPVKSLNSFTCFAVIIV